MVPLNLKPCPQKPNCVSSFAVDISHAVEPLRYFGDWLRAKQTLVQIVNQTPRSDIVKNIDDYLHVTFKSKILGFVDDVEFLFDDTKKIIHVRSASRVGYYDFGVNRHRVEKIRQSLDKTLQSSA